MYQIAMSRDAEGTQWLWEGGAKVVEELYSQQYYGRSQFDSQLMPVNAAAVQTPKIFEDYGSGKDMNYNGSAFLVLALAKELQRQWLVRRTRVHSDPEGLSSRKCAGARLEKSFREHV